MTAAPTRHESPYRLAGSPGESPLVLASPHSGRDYPASFVAQSRLTIGQLRRAEDAYVDRLLEPAAGRGVPLLAARYGRAYLDLNRAAAELDPAMIADPLPPEPGQASERVAAGLGIVPRIAAHGLDIYAARLRLAEVEARIAALHGPWHARIAELLAAAHARHGFAILLDCHSMPTPGPAPGGPPQFVLGDLHGASAAAPLVGLIARVLTDAGYRVARNNPYAGGFTTAHHADVAAGVHVVQIEIDRALYMDPARLTPHGGFAKVATLLAELVARIESAAPELGLGPVRQAAE
jgi:N-formylglutamate deformylase